MAAKKQKFKCGYCGKEFAREATVVSHKCDQRDKQLMRNTREGMVALDVWLKFRKFAKMPHKKSMQPYDAFAESREFKAFVEFAKYIIDKQPVECDKFIEHLLRDAIPLRDWTTEKVYNNWVHKILRTEPVDKAVQRSIESVQKWSEDTEIGWTKFFAEVSPQRAILMIETGRISPWFIYAASTKGDLLDRFSDEEFMHIYQYIDPTVWNAKKIKFKEDFEHMEATFKAFGI